jgi:YbbR domain-containing protein
MKKILLKIFIFILCAILAFFLFVEVPVMNKNEDTIIRNPKDPFIEIPMVTIPKNAVGG